MFNKFYDNFFIKKKYFSKISEMENDLNKINYNYIVKLLDLCIKLYDPYNNNYLEVESKFHLEYTKTIDNLENYDKDKQILFEKMSEKKYNLFNNNKKNHYYVIYMAKNKVIRIYKTEDIYEFVINNDNILYTFEYINSNSINIQNLINKYKNLYLNVVYG